MSDLQEHRYEHRPPRRPPRLARRVTPPPNRAGTPDLTLLLYVGLVLLAILAVVAVPYIVTYAINWLTAG